MAEQLNQSHQIQPEEENNAEVFSVSQDQDGSFHFSRRDFLFLSMAVGGTLLVKGVCPRFGTGPVSKTAQPDQAGMMPLPAVSIHARPSIESNIVDTLHQNDIVLLIADHPDLGWVEVSTQAGQQGWLMRSYADFSRAFTQASPISGFTSSQTSKPASTFASDLIRLDGDAIRQKKNSIAKQIRSCGETILNGDFESGHVTWIEEGTYGIITTTYSNPYQGSWVAWLGGYSNAQDKLTQLFHVPVNVKDIQTLNFYLKVETSETGSTVYDTLVVRWLDVSGAPLCPDVKIADNTTQKGWLHGTVNLTGMTSLGDQDIKLQFKGMTNATNTTSFLVDLVSLDLTCEPLPPTPTNNFIFLPIIVNAPTPTPVPTDTPTSTPCPSNNPCPSHIYPTSNPCSANSYCPPVAHCPFYHACICNSAPCYCNSEPCSCNAYPCLCNAYPY